jgi:hypothetical protein
MSHEKFFPLFTNRSFVMFVSAIGRLWTVMHQLLLLFLQNRIVQQMLLSQL